MKRLLIMMALIVMNAPSVFAQKRSQTANGFAVAFLDEGRLATPAGRSAIADFEYFFKMIQEIVKRDFPNVELKVLRRGELLRLHDGTSLNVQNMYPEIGYVLSAPGKKRRLLAGLQSDADFACAAAAFFQRNSSACPK
jgi:hypothetical protein